MAEIVRLEDLAGLDQIVERPSAIKRLRDHHHLIARLVAEGRRTTDIAAEVGLSISRVSILKGDPAFRQLVEMYRANYGQLKEAAFSDFYKKAALVRSLAAEEKLERYHEDPENLSNGELNADIQLMTEILEGKKTVNIQGSFEDLPLAEKHEIRRLRADRLSAQALPVAKGPESDASPTPARGDKDG